MRLLTLALATALVATSAHAGGRDDLTVFTKGLKGLDGTFTQQVFDANGKKKETSSGRVAMSAPKHFRWEYEKPFEQLADPASSADYNQQHEPDNRWRQNQRQQEHGFDHYFSIESL